MPDGFHERQVDRWTGFLERIKARDIPGLEAATDWLRAHEPLDFIPGLGRIFDSMWAFASSRVARAVVRGPLSKPVIVINPFAEN